MQRKALYDICGEILKKSGNEDWEFDTLCIFQDILCDKHPLFRPAEEVSAEDEKTIRQLTERRSSGYPLQYLLGEWEFYGYPFRLSEDVLIPRPDTETLIENVLEICRRQGMRSPRIADLCSGSGCIAITLKKELPLAEVSAVELSGGALDIIKENASLNDADIRIIKGDVLKKETADMFRDMDIIVSNPPYVTAKEMAELQQEVRYEPEMALYGGEDGLDFYRTMTALWKNSLADGGWLVYEYGDGQQNEVENILNHNDFYNITLSRDLAGIFRTASAQNRR
jgi:release factor glutamine methyltransferase